MELFVKVILATECVFLLLTLIAMGVGRPHSVGNGTRAVTVVLQLAIIAWAASLLYGR